MKFTTGKVRLSYVHVFEAKPDLQGRPKYSAALLIDKKDSKTLNRLKTAFKQILDDPETKAKMGGKMQGLDLPLRDGAEKPDMAGYPGCFYLNAKASEDHPPLVVDRDRNDIVDPAEIYSGCYAQAVISLYPYNFNGRKGIGVGLSAIRKLSDGAPLGGSRVTADDFSDDLLGDGVDDLL